MARLKDLDIYAIGDTIQMAGAVYSGEGKTWLLFFPGEKNDLPQEILEMDLEDWKRFLYQTDVLETVILEKAADGTLAKAIMRKSQRQIDNQVQWRVFRRDKYACRYCGNDACPLTVDHLVTWEDGGPSIEANLLTSCRKCNMIRDTTPYDQWLQHPRYRELSRRLSPAVQADNRALAATLADIPRVMHQRTRK